MKRDSGLMRPFRTPHLKATCSAIRRKRGLKSSTVLTAHSAGPPAGEMRRRDEGMTRLNRSIHFDNTNKDHFRAQRRRRPSAELDPLADVRRERSMWRIDVKRTSQQWHSNCSDSESRNWRSQQATVGYLFVLGLAPLSLVQ